MKFRMQIGVMDCLSCGNCVDVCPGNPKAGGPALKMVPKWEGFQDFLKGEVRFASVMKQFPTEAAGLFQACEDMAKKRYQSYIRMSKMDWSNE